MITIVNQIKSKFRILDNWTVGYDGNSEYRGQCARGVTLKAATIYPKGEADATDEEYVLHEMLHIAVAAISPDEEGNREREELFVRDICRLMGTNDGWI